MQPEAPESSIVRVLSVASPAVCPIHLLGAVAWYCGRQKLSSSMTFSP
jgi:hypothetical protein